jgi:hypothetical protein
MAMLLNANGIDGITYPYLIFGELRGAIGILDNLSELRSPFAATSVVGIFPHPVGAYKILLAVSLLALLLRLRRFRVADLLVLVAFGYLSVLAVRNMPLFAVVATPMTIRNLYGILDFRLARHGKTSGASPKLALATAASMIVMATGVSSLVAGNQLYTWLQWGRTSGIGERERLPAEVIAHLRKVEGNIFNTPDLGGYLIWKLYPEKQVAIDGRWEIYGGSLPQLLKAYRNPIVFAELAEQHNISAVVLSGKTLFSKQMAPWLRRSPEWKRTLARPNAVVFERISP